MSRQKASFTEDTLKHVGAGGDEARIGNHKTRTLGSFAGQAQDGHDPIGPNEIVPIWRQIAVELPPASNGPGKLGLTIRAEFGEESAPGPAEHLGAGSS